MDTTKKYIEMCKKAGEIQRLWVGKGADWYFNHGIVDFAREVDCIPNPVTTFLKGGIWLPRQDQLQEMIPVDCNCGMTWLHQSIKLDKFMNWLCNFEEDMSMEAYHQKKSYHTTLTWEQLWLVFVMKEKYHKTWTSKEWIKCNLTQSTTRTACH